MDLTRFVGVAFAIATCAAGSASAQEPALVAAYTRQLAERCGPLPKGAPTPSVVDRVDLTGDEKDEWVVDASRYPCPTRSAVAAAAGAQVTIFKGVDAAVALPVFQEVAFGARLERMPEGPVALVITVGGRDCGSDDGQARCDRRVVWGARNGRFELAAPVPASTKPAVKLPTR